MQMDIDSQLSCESIYYIDCRGYGDLVEELITLVIVLVLFWLNIKTYRNLKKQKQDHNDTQYQSSLRRKIILSGVQMAYLAAFSLSTIFGIYIFIPFRYHSDWVVDHRLDRVLKITQVIYIVMLNSLNLTVGLLYWKATRAYYVLSNLPIPFLFVRFFKGVFVLLYSVNLSAVVLSIVYCFTSYLKHQQIEGFTLSTTVLSIFVCIGCRALYRRKILVKVQLSQNAIWKQIICSILLLLSSLIRIVLYSVQIALPNWGLQLRNYEDNQGRKCLDLNFYYSLYLFGVNILVNLLPSFIYYYLFRAESANSIKESRRRNKKAKLNQPLLPQRKSSQNTNSNSNEQQQM